jgi:TnpA family transposase
MTEAGQKVHKQYADTGRFTDHVFAVTALPGFKFIPRIRALPSKRLSLSSNRWPVPKSGRG